MKNGVLHHTKTVNTSIETVINIDVATGVATGVAFVHNTTIKVQEFGILVRGGAMLADNHFEYVGASATNSHRFISLFKITSETRIHNNTFLCSNRSGTTRYSNFVFIGSTAGSEWTAKLVVSNNTQTGGDLRQFFLNDSLVPTGGTAELIVAGNSFNDFNGGIGLLSPAIYNGFNKITIVGNSQGADATGIFKGVFFVDGTGALNESVDFQYGGNVTIAGALRADYLSIASDTTNIVAAKNTVTFTPVIAVPIDEALETTGELLQELKSKRTHIVDGDGNPLPGFGTEDQPFIVDQAESANLEPTGFPELTSTISVGTNTGYDADYEFDSTATTFTLTPTPEQAVWVQGKKFVKTSPESVEITNDGLTFVYYGTDGVLAAKATMFDFLEEAPVAYVYRHDGKLLLLCDERHGTTMDGATHEYLHRTRGAAYATGFGANGFVLDGTGALDSEAKFNLAPGEFYDEDFLVKIQHGTGGYFTQPIETPAELPVFYHVTGGWEAVKATEVALLNTGTGRMAFNQKVAEDWSLEEISNNHFGIMFVMATNNLLAPVLAIMGQDTYGSKGAAEAELYTNLDLDGFPFYEFRPLYKLIFETRDAYSNSVKAVLRGVIDLRTIASSGLGTSAAQVNDHGSLTGLLDDDHPQYFNTERADERYLQETFETVNRNLKASAGVGVKDPATGLLESITYANGIIKTFAWDANNQLQSVTLSGAIPAGIDITKTFTWSASGFTFSYS